MSAITTKLILLCQILKTGFLCSLSFKDIILIRPSKEGGGYHDKMICLAWSNMPYKHDIVFSLKSLALLTPTHPQFRTMS